MYDTVSGKTASLYFTTARKRFEFRDEIVGFGINDLNDIVEFFHLKERGKNADEKAISETVREVIEVIKAMKKNGFQGLSEYFSALATGFGNAEEYHEFLEFKKRPDFREFLAQRGLYADYRTYIQFLAESQREEAATPADE